MSERKKLDIYDEEFALNLELAKNLIQHIENPKDRDICKKWVHKLCALKTTDVIVKKNRNSFFKYFLQILHKGVQGSDEHYGYPQINEKGVSGEDNRDFTCRWSADRRTYIAAKPLPGQGTLVYMAVSKDPSLGWEKEGATAYI